MIHCLGTLRTTNSGGLQLAAARVYVYDNHGVQACCYIGVGKQGSVAITLTLKSTVASYFEVFRVPECQKLKM